MIPRRIAFFWQGKTLGWLRYLTLASFRKHHPNWEMLLFVQHEGDERSEWDTGEQQDFQRGADDDGEQVDFLPIVSKLGVSVVNWEPAVPTASPVHACDLFQWWFLSRIGGVFCDLDVLFTAPIEPWYRAYWRNDCWLTCWGQTVAIGFLASGVLPASGDVTDTENPFFGDLYRIAEMQQDPTRYQAAGADAIYELLRQRFGHDKFRLKSRHQAFRAIRQLYPGLSITNLQRHPVYPFNWDEVDDIFGRVKPFDSALYAGIHWYAGAPLAQKWLRRLTPANYRDHDCTLTRAIAESGLA